MAQQVIKASTQEHLDIEDIKDDIVILKTGGAVAVLKTTAVNFDLLSEIEQDSMIAAYGNLLNSLSFHVQVILRSRKMDISEYLERVKAIEKAQEDSLLKAQTTAYKEFIQDLITKNVILDKEFYLVVPYSGTVLSEKPDPLMFVKQMFGFNQKRIRVNVDEVLKKGKAQLAPKIEHLTKEFSRVGIQSRQLKTEELVELYFDIYNPVIAQNQRAKLPMKDYNAPIVEPSLAEDLSTQTKKHSNNEIT